VDGTGSGSCPVAGFGISGVESSGSATRDIVSKMDPREIGCEDGRWMELAQNRVHWRASVQPEFQSVSPLLVIIC
jgi:hypothetical protein